MSFLKPCRKNSLRDTVNYPEWVVEDQNTVSDKDTDSDSEFQNLFKLIELNKYSTASQDNDDKTPSTKEEITEESGGGNVHFDPVIRGLDIASKTSPRARTPVIRPTLFMRSQVPANEKPKSSHAKRNSTSVSLGGSGGIAALRILFLQNAMAENILPVYRKKDRVYLSITQADFNRCHKSESSKIADRVRRTLNKNFIYLNDRDIAEDLEVKFEKIIQKRILKKSKQLEDAWKLKDPFPELLNSINEKSTATAKKLSFRSQQDFYMPHRVFETDITKYVKRLRELADFLNAKPNDPDAGKYEEIFHNRLTQDSLETERIKTDYLLIPTIETYNGRYVHNEDPTEKMINIKSSSEDEKVKSLMKSLSLGFLGRSKSTQ